MLRKLQVLAAASRLRTFTVAELARAANVPEATVHSVIQRSPADWFSKAKTATGARGGQPNRLELTASGATGIDERLSRLPTSVPLAAEDPPPAASTAVPMGISAARASLQRLPAATSPVSAEELRQEVLQNLEWTEAALDDGDFADNAAAFREEIRVLRRQLDAVPEIRHSSSDSSLYVSLIAPLVDKLKAVTARLEVYRRFYKAASRASAYIDSPRPSESVVDGSQFPKVFFSYFGSDPRAREQAAFSVGVLAGQVQNLGHDFIQPSDAHELLSLGEPAIAEFDQPLQLLLCVSTPSASPELRTILKQARTLIDKRCFTQESWVLDCGHNREVERVTRKLALNYEPNARQPSNWSRWADLIFVGAARAPLVPGALPFQGPAKPASETLAATPTTRLTTKRLSSTAFQSWTSKHAKGKTFTATIRQVDARGVVVDLGDGVQGHLKAAELTTESFKAEQKVPARYANSSQKRRTITVVLDTTKKEEKKPHLYALKGADIPSAPPKKMRSKSQA